MLEVIIYIAYGVLVILFLIMSHQLWFALRHFTPPPHGGQLPSEIDLPSVSVCIPARNETHAMTDCLERVIASTYPKLEVIVLDDVSVDNTSTIVKSFAHAGVRFVQGTDLPQGWLGKNHALQGLLGEASGSYILFMDVDTRLEPEAIEQLLRYTLAQRATMVSVLPRREDGWRASVIGSPLRYFWELMFHRRSSPATASNAWLIRRDVLLKRFNGFQEIKAAIQPESKLSAALAVSGEYRFLMSTAAFGIGYEKKWRSQLLTSIRLIYPLLGGKWAVALMAALDLAIFLIPLAALLLGFITGFGPIQYIGLIITLLFASLYGVYTRRVWRNGWYIGALLWPYIMMQEMILIIVSIIKYERKTVQWKGRPVPTNYSSF